MSVLRCERPALSIDLSNHLQITRGGGTTWDNAVAACEPCNQRKADRTPDEAGMRLLWEPFVPTKEDLTW